MNWLLRMFAVYFISLSLLSCSDTNDCSPVTGINNTAAATNHSSHDEHNESCSPFCSCSCCSIQFIAHHPEIGINTSAFFTNPDFSALHFNLLNIHLPIWQPPQLS